MRDLILIVDDNPDIRAFVRLCLESEDFRVIESIDGDGAMKRFEDEKPDLIILDIGIGQPDGIEVCRRIRKVSDVPIVMLTVQDEEIAEAMCLATGANDYITKPVSKIILCLRIKNQLRWIHQGSIEPATILLAENLMLNTLTRELKVDKVVVATTRTEFDFIRLLMQEPNRVFTREQICNEIGISAEFTSDHLLDTHASRLRIKIITAGGPRALSAVRTVGFRLF